LHDLKMQRVNGSRLRADDYVAFRYNPTAASSRSIEDYLDTVNDKRYTQSSDPDVRRAASDIQLRMRRLHTAEIIVFLSDGNHIAAFIGTLVTWFAFALIINWSASLDRVFTYQFRRRHFWALAGTFFVVLGLWSIYFVYYFAFPELWKFSRVLACLGALPVIFVFVNQTYKASMEIWREQRYVEGAIRVVFLALLVAQPLMSRTVEGLIR
jgi:hypothetical protein